MDKGWIILLIKAQIWHSFKRMFQFVDWLFFDFFITVTTSGQIYLRDQYSLFSIFQVSPCCLRFHSIWLFYASLQSNAHEISPFYRCSLLRTVMLLTLTLNKMTKRAFLKLDFLRLEFYRRLEKVGWIWLMETDKSGSLWKSKQSAGKDECSCKLFNEKLALAGSELN